MGPSQRGVHRLLPLSAEAWAAAEELAAIAGVTSASFVEGMLLELLLHHRTLPCRDLEPGTPEQSRVIPISQARHKRRHPSRRPDADNP
jgi:hypothetical protein